METDRVRIFGQLVLVERFARGPGFVGRFYDEEPGSTEEGEVRDWSQLPSALVTADGTPFVVNICEFNGRPRRRCSTLAELKEYAHDQLHPNAAKIRDIESVIDWQRTKFAEVERNEGDKYRLIRFSWSQRYNGWRAESRGLVDGYRIVYCSDRDHLVAGDLYACTFVQICVDNPPTRDRPGFQLIKVAPQHEHFDPDARIAWLREQIAAGYP